MFKESFLAGIVWGYIFSIILHKSILDLFFIYTTPVVLIVAIFNIPKLARETQKFLSAKNP